MNAGIEIVLVLLLIVLNGVFAMAEIALVSSKRPRLKKQADIGSAGAKVALELANSPNKFLATVQIGITLIGILAGVFGGDVLAERLAKQFNHVTLLAPYSHALSIGIVVLLITFLSLVIGELAPKRIGLNNPEGISIALSRPMQMLSRLTAPVVNFLSSSTDSLLKILGIRFKEEPTVSEEEVRILIEQGLHAGVFHTGEQRMVEGIFRLDELAAEDLMTPRGRIVWLNVDESDEVNWRKIVASGHSYFPVYQKQRDNVIGIVAVKALWANLAMTGKADLKSLVTEPLIVVPSVSATKLLETFKQTGKHIALVTDEFGGIQGLVTIIDVLEAIVGDIPSRDKPRKTHLVKREDGSWLCDGLLDVEELKRQLAMDELPVEPEEYQTVAGFALHQFGRIPKEGDSFEFKGWKFEIVDMDRHRIDKLILANKKRDPTDASQMETKL
jgi:putative hemolysin